MQLGKFISLHILMRMDVSIALCASVACSLLLRGRLFILFEKWISYVFCFVPSYCFYLKMEIWV